MLKLNQMDVPHYYVLSTSYGMEMVLFIPHFSSHDLQIIPFVDVDKSTTVFTQLISTGGLALIPVVLLFALLFVREKRKNRREIKRRRTRLNASRAPAE
jgi:hypothetical protein